MRRIAIRLCVLFLSVSIFTAISPSDASAQMCVRYARMLTGFNIQGDAWAWWANSAGQYAHGARPSVGSVLVFRRTGHLSYGHVSTVSKVIDRRTILVDHSWLEGDVLHRGMKVIDTSPSNNWSAVRVWYEPGDTLGQRTYPTFGFIYPRGVKELDRPLTVASADADTDVAGSAAPMASVAPRGRLTATQAALKQQSAVRLASATTVFVPHRKPVQAPVQARATVAAAAPAVAVSAPVQTAAQPAAAEATVLAYAPRHKPGRGETGTATAARPVPVEFTEVPQSLVPRHKPGTHGNHGSMQVADARGRDAVAEMED